jgi:UDP-N-acetylglucosamine 2-epimerase (non-hydrolysing)
MSARQVIMTVFGTRPEAIKLAPVVQALDAHPRLESVVVTTAQHRGMLDQVTELFDIRPDRDLDIMRAGQTLADITTKALEGLDRACAELHPDAVLVQGDTTSTLAGALAAFYHQVPVVHVEAGLRTFNRFAPYPEEINRQLTTRLVTLHLAPTPRSRDNLLAEGIDPADVVVTGNTVIDALHLAAARKASYDDPVLEAIDDDPRRVLVVTAHRRESWGEAIHQIGRALGRIAGEAEDLLVVVPVHPNPVVRDALHATVGANANVLLVEPLAYAAFARLLARADVLLTDSGGIQEEGPSLGKPVLVMRDITERPEAVEAGTVKLVGTDEDVICSTVLTLLRDRDAYERMANAVNPYGDGRATARCIAAIEELLGIGERLEEFEPAIAGG